MGVVFRRRPPIITPLEARAIAEAECAARGHPLPPPVAVTPTPWGRAWIVFGRSDNLHASGPWITIDAGTGAVRRFRVGGGPRPSPPRSR